MSNFDWVGGSLLGNEALNADNWSPPGVPVTGDNVNFEFSATTDCLWDITDQMNEFHVNGITGMTVLLLNDVRFKTGSAADGDLLDTNGFNIIYEDSFTTSGVIPVDYDTGELIAEGAGTTLLQLNGGTVPRLTTNKSGGVFSIAGTIVSTLMKVIADTATYDVVFSSSVATTISEIQTSGTGATRAVIKSDVPGNPATLNVSVFAIINENSNWQDILISGGSVTCDGVTCTDLGGNTNVIFTALPEGRVRVKQADILVQYVDRLRSNAALVTALGGDETKISTHLPQDTALPYIHIGLSNGEWGDKCQMGFETMITNNIWSAHRGPKEVLELSDIVIAITQNLQLSLTTGKNVLMTYQGNTVFEDSDGKSYRAALVLKLLSA